MAPSNREEARNLIHRHDDEEQDRDTELGPLARRAIYGSAPEARLPRRRVVFGAAMALAVVATVAAATLAWSPGARKANTKVLSEKYEEEGGANVGNTVTVNTAAGAAAAAVNTAACTPANGCINKDGEEYWEVLPDQCDFHNLYSDCNTCNAPCPTTPPCPTECEHGRPDNMICYTVTTTSTVTTATTTTMTTTMTTTSTVTTTTAPATTVTTTTTTPCGSAQPGSECYTKIMYAKTDDVVNSPSKYPGLSQESTSEEFQQVIHNLYFPDVCGTPCSIPTLGRCQIWADPHIISFDGLKQDYFTPGEYWVVRSDSVAIQARLDDVPISHGLACLTEVAIGGPFMDNHRLVIDAYKTTWDGQEIVGGNPSKFTNEWASIQHDNKGEVIQEQFAKGKVLDVLHIFLPNNVHMQIIRWNGPGLNYLNAIIKMPSIPGQDGICGNFNDIGDDDDKQKMRARFGNYADVPEDQMILDGTKMPIEPVDKPSLRNVDQATLEAAYAECKKYRIPPEHSCLIDFCFAGGTAMIDGE